MEERKAFLPEENEKWIMEQFGEAALQPAGDVDRPMTVEELQAFAGHPLVHIGNHSHRHPLFTQISEDSMHEEMRQSQELLRSWLGEAPGVMAWPNGSFSRQAEKIVASYGIRHSLSTQRRWYSMSQAPPF